MLPTMHRQRGFNLIDLMIGMVISMIAMLAVAVVFRDFGQQRNTQTQTLESQSNGTMALYLIERDMGQAGYGLMNLQNCPYINYYFNGTGYYNTPYGTATLPGSNNTALTTLPVRIIDGGTGSDTLEIQYGNSTSGVAGTQIASAVAYPGGYPVPSAIGFAPGDEAIANISNICTMVGVTNTNPVASPILHDVTSPYNVAAAPGGSGWNSVTAADLAASPAPYLANVGNFVSNRYQVTATGGTSALTLAAFPGYAATTVVDEIMFMKAQYGLSSTSNSTVVSSWVNGTTAITNANAQQVIAVRVGVIARSPLYEKNSINAPTSISILPAVATGGTLSAPSSGACATSNSTLEVKCTIASDHYRYRAYSTIIPLKNVLWTR